MAYTTIDKPSDYFETKLYTGNDTGQSITGVGFQPDWVWIKSRTDTNSHNSWDIVRGVNKYLENDTTKVETTVSNGVTSFDSDGFTVGSRDAINDNNLNFVSWNWLAGGSASSNSDGTETTNVSANTTAGFSIITYSGTTAVDTYGHGLSQKPEMMIFKTRAGASRNWVVYHKDIGATKHLHLNTTDAENTYQFMFNNTEPTNSVITLSDDGEVNKSGSTYVGYIFHGVKGFSKIGSYTGNGNADGTFVYTGFKPTWVMTKRTDTTSQWTIFDNKRGPINPSTGELKANESSAETSSDFRWDTISNGFKLRSSGAAVNASGGTYIYMCFAESPFVTGASAIPTTAR